jgi:hypothetical protein
MSATATPRGLVPVNSLGGTPYAGSTRKIKIASGYASNLYNGQVVKIHTDGTLNLVTETGGAGDLFPAGTIGVFVGCSYTDADLGFVNRQYWPTGQVASDAMGFVVDDPNALFLIQSSGPINQNDLGMNCDLTAAQSTSTGSTATGNSTSSLATGAACVATTSIGFRIVDFVDGPDSTVGDAYTDTIVKFNHIAHSYLNPTGSA